jgi:integrase
VPTKLTEKRIESLSCPEGKRDKLEFDTEQRGLAVRTTSTGGQSYLCQYTANGIKRRVPLGAVNALSLADARAAGRIIMGAVAAGRDPALERKAKRDAARDVLTFDTLLDNWAGLHLANRRERYRREALQSIRRVFGNCLSTPITELSRSTILAALDRYQRDGKPVAAARAAAYAKACLGWALKRGMVINNPFASLPVAAAKKRDRTLTSEDIARLWEHTAVVTPFNGIVRLLLLTGARRNEIARLSWTELSDNTEVWVLPGGRSKNHRKHTVPLSKQARQVIFDYGALPAVHTSDYLFQQGGDGTKPFRDFARGKQRLDETSGVTGWTLHDLRRTVATGMSEIGIQPHIVEAVLNHVSGHKAGVAGVYNHAQYDREKKAALAVWADWVEAIVERRDHLPAGSVVML